MAEAHAIDLIAKTTSKRELQVFKHNSKTRKIEKIKDNIYWRLNIQPNNFENGTMFLYKLMVKLLTDKQALIVINRDLTNSKLLYIADDFNMSNSILYGKTFYDVVIADGNGNSLPMTKTYTQEDAIYYSLKNSSLNSASDSFKSNSAKLFNSISESFLKANAPKWRLKVPGNQPTMIDPITKKPISYDDYKKKITEGLFDEKESVVFLAEAFDLINLNKDNNKNLSDYKDIIKEVGDTVARKWDIPLDIFYGSKTEKSTSNNDLITFAVSPYWELLEDGFNITLVGKDDYLKGEYISFNKLNITHKDILESASGIDKLTSNGFSRNEVNELLGLPRINEPWADEHYITKNYGKIEGGEKE